MSQSNNEAVVLTGAKLDVDFQVSIDCVETEGSRSLLDMVL
jgi:hypothetical protein